MKLILQKIASMVVMIFFFTMLLCLIWNLVKSQPIPEKDSTNILFKNVMTCEYFSSYNTLTGIQTVYYMNQENPYEIVIYTKLKDAMDFLQLNFVNQNNNTWISDDKKYVVTMSMNRECLYLIKQRYHEPIIKPEQRAESKTD